MLLFFNMLLSSVGSSGPEEAADSSTAAPGVGGLRTVGSVRRVPNRPRAAAFGSAAAAGAGGCGAWSWASATPSSSTLTAPKEIR